MIAVVHARREYGGVHRAGVRGVRRALTALLDGAVGSGRINGRHLSPAGVEDVQRQRVSEVLGLPLDLVLDAPDGYGLGAGLNPNDSLVFGLILPLYR